MIKLIAAISSNNVIGLKNKLPFDYPEDLKHFKEMTLNKTIIMGRKTFEGIGRKLPKRRNIVISRTKINIEGIETFDSIDNAIMACTKPIELVAPSNDPNEDVWLIGGAKIYEEGLKIVDEIYITLTPDYITDPDQNNIVYFPYINPLLFKIESIKDLAPGSQLKLIKYIRA